jgi:uroporphyrinogen decarboxylase
MDSKTRVLKALDHEKPDRVPFNFWMDRRLMGEYEKRIGHRHWRVTHYGADVIETFPALAWPQGRSAHESGSDWIVHPLFTDWSKADDISLPDPTDEDAYALIRQDLEEFPDKAVFLDVGTTFGLIANMRTHKAVYMDMLDHPEEFLALSRRICDVLNAVLERACELGVTSVYLMEDLASTKGLMMSPAMIRRFCLDFAREQAEIARSAGVPVLFHSDGQVADLLPLLLEIGVCAVNPLQNHLHDYSEFQRVFGEHLALYGGLDNSFTIPDGSPEDVRRHVLDVFEAIGKPDGALILSSHDIPLNTPAENVEILVKTIREECIY